MRKAETFLSEISNKELREACERVINISEAGVLERNSTIETLGELVKDDNFGSYNLTILINCVKDEAVKRFMDMVTFQTPSNK